MRPDGCSHPIAAPLRRAEGLLQNSGGTRHRANRSPVAAPGRRPHGGAGVRGCRGSPDGRPCATASSRPRPGQAGRHPTAGRPRRVLCPRARRSGRQPCRPGTASRTRNPRQVFRNPNPRQVFRNPNHRTAFRNPNHRTAFRIRRPRTAFRRTAGPRTACPPRHFRRRRTAGPSSTPSRPRNRCRRPNHPDTHRTAGRRRRPPSADVRHRRPRRHDRCWRNRCAADPIRLRVLLRAALRLVDRHPGAPSHRSFSSSTPPGKDSKSAMAATARVTAIAKDVRRRPTLPRGPPRSTIGADRLSFRVRNGAGRFPVAMTAVTLWRCQSDNRPYLGNRTVDASKKIVASCRLISTGQLHVSVVHASTSGLSTQ